MRRTVLALLTVLGAAASGLAPVHAADNPEELARRAIERRAVEAVIWGMPAVNYDLMLQEMLSKTPAKVHQVVYWGRPLDSKNHAHAESRRALLHGVLQHQGRSGRTRSAAR